MKVLLDCLIIVSLITLQAYCICEVADSARYFSSHSSQRRFTSCCRTGSPGECPATGYAILIAVSAETFRPVFAVDHRDYILTFNAFGLDTFTIQKRFQVFNHDAFIARRIAGIQAQYRLEVAHGFFFDLRPIRLRRNRNEQDERSEKGQTSKRHEMPPESVSVFYA